MDEELEKIKERKLRELQRRYLEKRKTSEEPAKLTDASFDQFLKSYPAAVIDLWAEWCMPCQLVAPVVEELAKRYAGKVVFGKLNVDENPKTAAKFNINAIPTLLFFKSGKLVDQVVGVAPADELERRIKSLLQ